MQDKFCVIGKSVSSNIGRTWVATQEMAVEHAKDLIRAQGKNAQVELYVVEIKKVIRTIDPPIEVVDVA